MNDNKTVNQQNQGGMSFNNTENKSIFETVPIEENKGIHEEASSSDYPDIASAYNTPPAYEENKTKYLFVGLGVIFFVVIFVLLINFLRRFKLPIINKKNKEISLTYWGLWEEKQLFDPLIKKYQAKNPNISIDYIKMDHRDYREKLIERSKSGDGPDIFRFHNTWLPTLKEIISPLPKDIMSNSQFEKIFYPVAQKDLKIAEFYYGLPLEIDGLVLLYNDDLFKKAGIAVPPATWEDVINDVAQLTVKDQDGKIITSGIALGTASNVEHFSDIFGWMLLQNGGSLNDLSSSEAQDALEAYRKFAELPKNVWDENMPNSIPAFIQGRVAMIIIPSWEILSIKTANSDLKFKVTALPIVPGGNKVSIANYWIEGVSKLSENQLEAWKFLKFLIEKENLTTFFQEAAKMRLFGEPYSRVDLASTLVQNEYIGPVILQASYMKSLPLISKTYDNGLNDEIIKYLGDAINATANGVAYQEALLTAQKGIMQVFEKYKIE